MSPSGEGRGTPSSDQVEQTFGPFVLLRQIAIGGMAEVYLARTVGIGGFQKRLALKMIHPKFSEDSRFIDMFVEEAKIAVLLNHANIGQIFDLGRMGNTYYIAMEYVDGVDLHRLLRKVRERAVDVPVEAVCYVGACVAAGLDYAHHRQDAQGHPLGIVHRDISPQNVLVSFDGEVKIVDFGIAKAALRARETEAGIIKGKFSYMSPEQARGEAIDHRSDIYSTGIILHELLCGQSLFRGENVAEIMEKVRKSKVTPPSLLRPETPAALERTILHALAKRPRERLGSALELHRDLSRILAAIAPTYGGRQLGTFVSELFAGEKPSASGSRPLERHEYPVQESQSVLFDLADPESFRAVLEATREPGRAAETRPLPDPALARGADSTLLAGVHEVGHTQDTDTSDDWGDETVFDPGMEDRVREDADGPTTPAAHLQATRGPDVATRELASAGQRAPKAGVDPVAATPTKPSTPAPRRSGPPPIPVARPAPGVPAGAVAPPATSRPSAPPPLPVRAPSVPPPPVTPPTTRPAAPFPAPAQRLSPIVGGLTREVRALRKMRLPALPVWALILAGFVGLGAVLTVVVVLRPAASGEPVILVRTTPSHALVRVAGIPRAHPVRAEGLAVGTKIRAEASAPGYVPWVEDIDVQPGVTQYNVVLMPLRGTLHVESVPPGAMVVANGVSLGVTPLAIPNVHAAGQIVLDLSLAGFQSTRAVHVWDGSTSGEVRVVLQPER